MISLAIFLQTIEMLLIKKAWKIWPSNISDPLFTALLAINLFSAIAFFFIPHPIFVAIMLFSTVMIAWRFRGSFNGGADYMTVAVLVGLLLPKPWGYWYIVVQLILSYVLAGYWKLKNPDWRTGRAIQAILARSNYIVPKFAKNMIQHQKLSFLFSWALIVFECTFFVVLFSPTLFWIYALTALGFHLGNFYAFGLNRFVFAWAAAYPALYWVVNFLSA